MAATWLEAWEKARTTINGDLRDAFRYGFHAGWRAQENRPFHCVWCQVELIGETDGETIALAQDHTRACEVHPLAIENRALQAELERWQRMGSKA